MPFFRHLWLKYTAFLLVLFLTFALLPIDKVHAATPLITQQNEGDANYAYRLFGGDDDPSRISASAIPNYKVFLLSPYMLNIAAKIEANNPTAVIYMYKDASSTRRNLSDPQSEWCNIGGDTIGRDWGVDYCDTDANHTNWFMTVSSSRFEYSGYDDHWHTDVGAAGYKEQWTTNVIEDLQNSNVWDGVFIDNQLTSITAYTPGEVFPDQYASDALGQAAYDTFIDYAADQITGAGFGVAANMSNARLYSGLWNDYTEEQSGGFDEFWTTFGGTDASPNNLGVYVPEGWQTQIAELTDLAAASKMGIFSAQTSNGVCNTCAIYGYASYLLANNGRQVFMESYGDNEAGNWVGTRTMYSWDFGAATSSNTEIQGAGSNLFQRTFTNGLVILNADYTDSATVILSDMYYNENGAIVTSVSLDPLRATILRPVTPSQTPTPSTPSSAQSNTIPDAPLPPYCQNMRPGIKEPKLYAAVPQSATSILLYFTAADEPYDHYTLTFGEASNVYLYGAEDFEKKGARTYLVQHLRPNEEYFFRIRAGNGCAPGPWSNEIQAKTPTIFSEYVNKL